MLNSPPVASTGKTHSPPVQLVATPPKHEDNDNVGEIINETSQEQTKSTSDKILDQLRTSSKSDESDTIGKLEEKPSSKDCVDKLEEMNETKSVDHVTSPSAGQKHLVNKIKTESKESLPDTKIRIKVETANNNESFKVKTDSKVKIEPKKVKNESESKHVGEVKNNTEKTLEKGSESGSKNSSKLGVKLKKPVNGVVKTKKSSESKLEKKLDEAVVEKRKRKHSSGDKQTKETSELQSSKLKANLLKDKVQSTKIDKTEELSSKDTSRTKSVNKERKKTDRSQSFGFDCPEGDEEDSVIDVVGNDSPVVKKKKSEQNGMNGVHKNGHVEMPLGIQLVHDQDKDPTSLIVKIPLSFLKRIPSKFAQNLSVSAKLYLATS
jgi:hypothetical protein